MRAEARCGVPNPGRAEEVADDLPEARGSRRRCTGPAGPPLLSSMDRLPALGFAVCTAKAGGEWRARPPDLPKAPA